MKTLQESLFDKNINKSDVLIGELYELSDVSHHNSFSNSPSKFIEVFDKKKLLKLKHHFVDSKNNFIEYWEKRRGIDGLSALIDCILCAPAQTFTDPNNVVCEKALKNYLKPFVDPKKYNDLFISINRFSTSVDKDHMIDIRIYDNLMSSSPNSMEITIIKK